MEGGLNLCPNVLGNFFYESLYLGKMPKEGGGGGKAMQNIWSTFNGFILLNSIEIVLYLGNIFKRGEGRSETIGALFLDF